MISKAVIYIQAFEESALFAKKRNVPDILETKADIDKYFGGGNGNG